MVYCLQFTVNFEHRGTETQSFPLTKTIITPDNGRSLLDFCSGSRAMVFICKHLRPYPLNLCTFLRQLMPLSGKNKKNSVVLFEGYEEEPTPSPSQRDGSWNDSVEDC